jgi:bifunctional non-homologous end joining protein LigD
MPAVLPGLESVPPMLAAAGTPPPGEGWAYEFKYDGVRAITYAAHGQVRALSRNGNDVTGSYPELAGLPQLLDGHRVILDGEIVALEPGDRPSFALLQQRIHQRQPPPGLLTKVPVKYYVFDVLHLDGEELTGLPYSTRREILEGLGLDWEHVKTPAGYLDPDSTTMLKAAEIGGYEGIVAKKLTSPYRPGKRSGEWTKVPLVRTQEVLVIGWKPGMGKRHGLPGSLLLGVYDPRDRLAFAGHVGTGFTDAMLRQLEKDLAPLTRTTPVVTDVPREHARNAHWVEPCLIGEVAFRNWTPDGRLRHPSWRGLRTDKTPASAHRVPQTVLPPPQGEVIGAMQTRNGTWRVEAVRRSRNQFYRLVHGENVIDGLSIATVERLLAQAGVSMDELIPVTSDGGEQRAPGAA